MSQPTTDPNDLPTLWELAHGAKQAGIECPKCGCREWRVRNTRQADGFIKRYRVCRHCAEIITTEER